MCRKENIVVQDIDGEILIYDLIENKAFCLNRTSALVWQACDGKRTVAEITELLGKQLNSEVKEDIVWLALDQLNKESLIQKEYRLNEKFSGLSRREVIRKIGLTSVIALPIITSLVAPLAIHANSACIPVNNACTCPGAGTVGTFCPSSPCANSNCRCQRKDAGANPNNGNCVP